LRTPRNHKEQGLDYMFHQYLLTTTFTTLPAQEIVAMRKELYLLELSRRFFLCDPVLFKVARLSITKRDL